MCNQSIRNYILDIIRELSHELRNKQIHCINLTNIGDKRLVISFCSGVKRKEYTFGVQLSNGSINELMYKFYCDDESKFIEYAHSNSVAYVLRGKNLYPYELTRKQSLELFKTLSSLRYMINNNINL